MISANLSHMLSNLGWGSGFRLPVANDENRALESLLEEKQKELLRLNALLESDTQHCQVLKNHLDRVSKTVTQSQKMVGAKKGGIETENNLLSISERVLSRVKSELKTTAETIHDYHDRNLRMTNEVDQRRRHVEQLVATVKFDRVALERYKQVAQDKENDIEHMSTLSKLDGRIEENFQLKFARAGEDLSTARVVLHEQAMTTSSLQQRFNRLCSQFRRLHVERGQAVSFWESTLKSMKQRDEDIKEVAEEYADVRVVLQQMDSQCERNRQMLQAEKQSTGAIDYHIAASDKVCVNQRIRIADGKELSSNLRDEILAYNTMINTTSRMIKEVKTTIQKHENELALMQSKLNKAQAELLESKERFDMAIMETMSEEAKAREYEKMIEQEESRIESIMQDVEKQRRYLWQRSNDLSVLEEKTKSTMTQIKGTKAMIVAFRDRAKNDDIMIQKKRQQAYHLELECVGLEARIQNIISEEIDAAAVTGPNKADLPKLREKMAEVTKTKAFLTAQEAHLHQVNRRIIREIHAVQAEHAQLELHIETEKMESKRCTMDTQKAIHELQNAKIDFRMLEMSLKRLIRWSQEEEHKLVSLEQERLLLDAVAKERRAEIALHMGLLQKQYKHLREERNRIQLHFSDVLAEIQRHKNRYEYVITCMNLAGEDGAHSESYYILKHAQEKEALRREGDLWDVKVKETEKEIAALQNTLSVIVSSNMAFKESLAPAAADTPEAKMIADLEDEYRRVLIRRRKADRAEKEIFLKFRALTADMHELTHSRVCLEGMAGEKKYELNNIHYELANQKAKIARASRLASKLVKDLGLHLHGDRELIEADLKLRCAREKFEFALKTLEKSLFLHAELRDKAIAFLEKTELDTITVRLRRRMRQKDGTESPYYSGQVTPVRYLTPVSSTNMTNLMERHVYMIEPPSSKPSTPPASLASKATSRSNKSVKSSRGTPSESQEEPERDTNVEDMTCTAVPVTKQDDSEPKNTETLFKSGRRGTMSRSEVFQSHTSQMEEEEDRRSQDSMSTSGGTDFNEVQSSVSGSRRSSTEEEAASSKDAEKPGAGKTDG